MKVERFIERRKGISPSRNETTEDNGRVRDEYDQEKLLKEKRICVVGLGLELDSRVYLGQMRP